jgi:hypothetical protein
MVHQDQRQEDILQVVEEDRDMVYLVQQAEQVVEDQEERIQHQPQ